MPLLVPLDQQLGAKSERGPFRCEPYVLQAARTQACQWGASAGARAVSQRPFLCFLSHWLILKMLTHAHVPCALLMLESLCMTHSGVQDWLYHPGQKRRRQDVSSLL